MSLVSASNNALARRPDLPPLNDTPRNMAEVAEASGDTRPGTPMTDALRVITTYIPVEVITLYVAVLAVLSPEDRTGNWVAFFIFFFLTPVVLWLVFANKLKAAGKPVPAAFRTWPLWKMTASTITFTVWAFSLSQRPTAGFLDWYSPAMSGVVVLGTATLLGLIAPLMQKPLGT